MMKKLITLLLFMLMVTSCGDESDGSELVDSSSSSGGSSTTATTGDLSGIITDASSGAAINAATVYISGSQSGTSTTTDANGAFTITDSPSGSQSIIATKTSYASVTVATTVAASVTTAEQNFTMMTSAYASSKYVIILSWGSTPTDLDAHLFVGNAAQDPVWYSSVGSVTIAPFAALDVDDTDGEGPETLRITKNGAGPYYSDNDYRYYVYNFSNEETFANSSAVVRVYNDGTLVKTYNVPTTGSGRWWHIFDMNSTGTITDVNTVGSTTILAP